MASDRTYQPYDQFLTLAQDAREQAARMRDQRMAEEYLFIAESYELLARCYAEPDYSTSDC